MEALGQAITDAAFCFDSVANSTLSTDKTLRKCVLFLQSTPQQNWILLSEYHNRSSSYQDHCSAVATHEYYSVYTSYIAIIPLNIGYIVTYNKLITQITY